ncbi:MAG TPA: HEAT repeat domain-containing protein [Longimicrobiaceae bacterium]|nr:HEAT repeat domain-containing protein [Longimicrobiaceae bacterium]
MPTPPVPPALIRDLAKAYTLSEFYPVTHPTLEQALERLERDLLAVGGELRVDVEPASLRVGKEWAAWRSAHVTRFAARLAGHGVHSFTLRADAARAEDLGRFLSATALPVRVVRAAGGFVAALSAAGTRGLRVNGVAPEPPKPSAAPAAAPGGGVDFNVSFWSAHQVYELVKQTAVRVEQEDLEALRAELVGSPEADRVQLVERMRQTAQWAAGQGRLDQVVAVVLRLRADAEELARHAPARRAHTMLALAKLGTPAVVDELVARLGCARSEEERAELQSALLHLGAETVTPLVRALTDAQDRSARRAYRDALVALERTGIPLLEDMAGDERWFVVRNMVNILGEIPGAESLEHFARTVQHPDARVRRETVQALTRLGGEEAVPLLVRALSDPDPGIRGGAALGLGLTRVPAAAAALLLRLGQEGDAEVETEIVRALGRLGDPRAVQPLAEREEAGGWLSRRPVEGRVEAVRALAAIGGERARGVLQRLAGDRSAEVRDAVERALHGESAT